MLTGKPYLCIASSEGQAGFPSAYPANALLAVQRELACNVFDSPDNCRGCDFYAPEMLLTYNEKGAMVPNHSVIKSIAKRYY